MRSSVDAWLELPRRPAVPGYPRGTVPMEPDSTHSEASAWQAAIDFGIDVTLLAANLERTPAQRLCELVAMNRFQAEVQARTVPPELRRRLDAEELVAKFGALLSGAP